MVAIKLLNRELNDGAGSDFAIEQAAAFSLSDAASVGLHFGFDEESVAGGDGLAEFNFVGRHKVADLALVFGYAENEDAGCLRHGFEL